MRTIIEGSANVNRLLGKQKAKDSEYRLMKYVLSVSCNEGTLLHNVITGQLVLLNSFEKEILSSPPITVTNVLKELIESYFIVPISFDEKELVDNLRVLIKRLLMPGGINNYVIFTTTDCNARCFYCFESGCSRLTMDESTGEKIAEYMMNHRGEGNLRLRWFGGEPLLGVQRIDQICSILNSHKIEYVSAMISNGYLFTDAMMEKAINLWHLQEVQITLDGTEEVYNKTKAYVNTKGSPYKTVLNNIELLISSGIQVNIRINLDKHNKDDLNKLIEDISRKFQDRRLLHVYVSVVEKGVGYAPLSRTENDDITLHKQQNILTRHLEQIGFAKRVPQLPMIETSRCMADNANSIVIYPNGFFYKCEHVVEEDFIGNLEEDSLIQRVVHLYEERLSCNICNECVLYPTCIRLKKCPASEADNAFTCEMKRKSYENSIRIRYDEFVRNEG